MGLLTRAPKELSGPPLPLHIRKLADYSEGTHTRVKKWNPDTGESFLADPSTGEPKPWPLLGIVLVEAPQSIRISTNKVNEGRLEGWITLTNQDVKHEPGGPPEDPWRVTHTFEPADELIFKTIEGPVKYKIVHNPGRYPDGDQMRVDWFYDCEKVTG